MVINNFKFLFLIISINNVVKCETFESIWYSMQAKYHNLKANFLALEDANKYFAEYWKATCNEFDKVIRGAPNICFLDNEYIRQAMRRVEFGKIQKFEECFLENCISEKNKAIVKRFKDNDNNLLQKGSKFNCSANSLGHLFYAMKIAESVHKDPDVIIEFGGGYGNLCNIFKQIYPNSTIVIFDIPESIALQYLFLKYTNPELDIIIHNNAVGNDLQKGVIHLVCVNFLETSKIKADVFVSTFALTESPEYVQNLVISKDFFSADLIYVVGQIGGWKASGHRWMTDHQELMQEIRKTYSKVYCNPFHIFEENLQSYELIAQKG